jgi:site-specific DNA-methyltransferase (adenine-specific)
MKNIPDKSVDAIIADWPYGTTRNKWDSVIPLAPLWAECKRVIKDRGAIVLFSAQPFTSALVMSNLDWFKYEEIWDKKNPRGYLNAKIMPLRRHENILIFGDGRITYNPQMRAGKVRVKGGKSPMTGCYNQHTRIPKTNGDYYPTSILEFTGADQRNKVHTNQKPVALLEYLIRTYTNEGETVLDNTMGSGSTLIACMNTGRNGIGIEKDPDIFQTAKQRIEGHTWQLVA